MTIPRMNPDPRTASYLYIGSEEQSVEAWLSVDLSANAYVLFAVD